MRKETWHWENLTLLPESRSFAFRLCNRAGEELGHIQRERRKGWYVRSGYTGIVAYYPTRAAAKRVLIMRVRRLLEGK